MRQQQTPARTPFSPTLPFVWLVPAWILWGSGTFAALGLFAFSVPTRFHQLTVLSAKLTPSSHRVALGPLTVLLRSVLSANIYPVIILTQESVLTLGLTLVGLVLFWRKPRQWPAMLFSLAMITYGPYITGALGALQAVQPGLRLPINVLQTLGIGAAVLSGYLFPDGRFVPPWTRLSSLCWILWIVAAVALPSLPFDFGQPYSLDGLGFLALIGWLCTTLVAQLERYRRTSGLMQRRQTKWVLICMTSTIVTYSVFLAPRTFFPALGQPDSLYALIGYPLFLAALPLSPVVIFIAILRYHLFDIDTVVNRALVYGSLTLVLALIYAASIVLLQFVLSGLTSGSELALVGSTLGTAALFQPLRIRIQRAIDRRFYRRKYDAAKTLAQFGATLRNQVDLEQVCEQLEAVVKETMRPTHVSLWLRPRPDSGSRGIALHPQTGVLMTGAQSPSDHS